ncbi:MAG TPA: hypothetical protein VKY40_10060, partial [Halanaerobiales bacterium]|nr:hypothetical protein [Halanaerobiales bacterium]
MSLYIIDVLKDNKDAQKNRVKWRYFPIFLIICLLLTLLLIHWFFPGYISEGEVRKIPIIIDPSPGEVRTL